MKSPCRPDLALSLQLPQDKMVSGVWFLFLLPDLFFDKLAKASPLLKGSKHFQELAPAPCLMNSLIKTLANSHSTHADIQQR